MNLSLIQTNDYNTTHLSTSCYKNGFDLLRAYNYIDTNLSLTISDIEALLPPLLYTVENPGCQRQPPPRQRGTFLDVCLFGVILLVFTKCVHLLSIHIVKNKYSRGFANNKSSITDNSDVDFSSAQCSQWFCLGFIAFICGLMLGSIIYHFIPQIYEIPNESFDYMYLGRATLIFCGIYLFFIVEKLLHLRLKVDETSSNETLNDTSELAKLSTEDMSQIAKMHKTLNVEREDNTQHMHLSDAPAIPVHFHSHDDDADLQSNICSLTTNNTIHHHHHHPTNNIKTGTCNLIFYHVIGDSLNDFIYGCSLSTALAQHHLIGLVVWFVILMDGFRRHLQTTSLIGRKYSTYLLLVSLVVLLFGFIVGGLLGDVSKPTEQHQTVVRGEYIYSITYGTFFYSALVTLIPKLHELGQHLQIVTKPSSQILGQQRHMKIYVLMCQNLFLLLGVLVPFIIAVVWRRFHRLQMMMTMNLIIIFGMLHVGLHPVVSLNTRLSHLEADVLYSHLKNQTNLELFYEKLIKSNGVDDPTHVHRSITEDDIRQGIIEHKCFKSTDDLLNAFDIRPINENISLTRTDVQRLFPVLIDIKFNGGCQKSHGFAMWKNILIGLIAVSVLNCSALFGAIILPFHKKPAFKWILSSFIGLAVGTLIGTGIFHLIPMAFNVPHFDTDHAYLNKALITIIVIYLFFIRDQLFKIFFNIEAIGTHNHNDSDDALSPFQKKNSKNLWHNLKTMKAAGWMILISDMLHCFIDGITLGAVSMVSISEGLRMLLPIICEEFPHKLGDIAVLLSSGLTNGQALIMCFLSACCSYPGFLIGAKLGELEEFHRWIYAFAGGMFVYIGLADMVPELVSIGAEIEKNYADINRAVRTKLRLKILICQNIGVTLGIGIMFALAKYDELLFGTSH